MQDLVRIKVLWVDDQDLSSFVDLAYYSGIDIERKGSWEEALPFLSDNFRQFNAIILDCYCPTKSNGPEDKFFLKTALTDLNRLFGQYHPLPWFVLSYGSRDNFADILELSVDRTRESYDREWGKSYYDKNNQKDVETLLSNIQSAVSSQSSYWLRNRYSDVFWVIDKYFAPEAEECLMKLLRALHFPDEERNFEPKYYFNAHRHILEHFFRACAKCGLIPEEISKDPNGNLPLHECLLFIQGSQPKFYDFSLPSNLRYPKHITDSLALMLLFDNPKSHTTDKKIDFPFKYSLYGSAVLLCELIKWLGEYTETNHPEVKCLKDNKTGENQIINLAEKKKKLLGNQFVLKKDFNGIYHCAECYIGELCCFEQLVGQKVTITNIELNSNHCNDKYPIKGKLRPGSLPTLYVEHYYPKDENGEYEMNNGPLLLLSSIASLAINAGGIIILGQDENGQKSGIEKEFKDFNIYRTNFKSVLRSEFDKIGQNTLFNQILIDITSFPTIEMIVNPINRQSSNSN